MPLKGNGVLAIRREDKSLWERRAPLAPKHVAALVEKGIRVIVQPSTIRIFPDHKYREAGAEINEDLSCANVIIGVKEVPPHLLISDCTYLYFAHVIKAQDYNMKMLDTILEKNIRLLDHERILDDSGKRLVKFGHFAGFAGMVDTLRGLGLRLLYLKHSSPLLHVAYSHMYSNLENVRNQLRKVGQNIAESGLPPQFSPYIVVITGGEGAVAKGVREVVELLPHQLVMPKDLKELVANPPPHSTRKLYVCVVSSADYLVRADAPEGTEPNPETFDKKDFYAHPENYRSVFHDVIAPYASILMNTTYWDNRLPRVLTNDQLKEKYTAGLLRWLIVGELACDVGGSLEFLPKCSTIEKPVFVYNPASGSHSTHGVKGDGFVVMSVDILPTELPYEASMYFGDNLLPYLPDLAWNNGTAPLEQQLATLPAPLRPAVITDHGSLTPRYKYIDALRATNESKWRHILIIGSGFVAPALVNDMMRDPTVHLTIASNEYDVAKDIAYTEGEKLNQSHRITPHFLDLNSTSQAALEQLISKHVLVISLVPAFLHHKIAAVCIKLKRNMTTASYISPEMKELNQAAIDAGVVIFNEIGLDPGIDHLLAVTDIHKIKEKGGKIISFKSMCGGLPAPESAINPLRYKFTWNPRGVIHAGNTDAQWLQDGKETTVKGGSDLYGSASPITLEPCFSLEVLPNRNALPYKDLYDLVDAQTVFRGTLRYTGFSSVMKAISDLGLLSTESNVLLATVDSPTWVQLTSSILGVPEEEAFSHAMNTLRTNEPDVDFDKVEESLKWLGFFSNEVIPPSKTNAPVDATCAQLLKRLPMASHDRDLALLYHVVDVEWKDGSKERLATTLMARGNKEFTAMGRTVSAPLSIASRLIYTNKITDKGVIGPFTYENASKILHELKQEDDVVFMHSKVKLPK